jgi:hypothetical protein
MMMEALRSFETSILTRAKLRHIAHEKVLFRVITVITSNLTEKSTYLQEEPKCAAVS